MAGLINLKLFTDFFNKIGPSRHFAFLRSLVAIRGTGDSGKPTAWQFYGFMA